METFQILVIAALAGLVAGLSIIIYLLENIYRKLCE